MQRGLREEDPDNEPPIRQGQRNAFSARRGSDATNQVKGREWVKIERTLEKLVQYHENSKKYNPAQCSVKVLLGLNWATVPLTVLEEVYGAVEKVEKELADGKHEYVRGMRVSTDVRALLVRLPPSLPY